MVIMAASAAGKAGQAQDVLRAINGVASALTDGDPSGAMTPFDKSAAGYETLANEFSSLTNAYSIANEVDVVDEEDGAEETSVTLHWILTLTNIESSQSNRKAAEVHARLRLENKKWKIVEFSPLDLFTP